MTDTPPPLASLFEAAVQIESAADRAAFLERACGDDRELRKQVERLLQSHERAGDFLAKPILESEAAVNGPLHGDLAASMEAGLAATFGPHEAVVVGEAGHSVLKMLGQTLDRVPRVALRDSFPEGDGPVVRPKTAEIPQKNSDSRYQVQGEIARGGMGAILKGRDTDLGRDLAIKVLLDQHKDRPEVVQRFVEEAQIGGQLQHPGIAPVYELGQFADRRPFFSMKLVKGQTLSKLLADRTGPADDRTRFIGIFEQICQTMAYAHSRGVIHRDLKPANIMVGAFGEVQVMDWGLAKVLAAGGVADERKAHDAQHGQSMIHTLRSKAGSDAVGPVGMDGSQTQMGCVMGTPAYMPPEQALGEIDLLDERADVFGLGAILCEVLTGKPPYVGADGTHVYRMAARGRLEDCFERLDQCEADAELVSLAKNCLAIEPRDRPRNSSAVAARVTGYLESVETRFRESEIARAAEAARAEESLKTAQSHEAAARAERRARRMQVRFVSAVLLAVLIGCIGAAWTAAYQSGLKNQALDAKDEANKARVAESKERERAQQEEQRAKAETRRAESEKLRSDRMSAGLAFDRGLQSCADGNVVEGLLWMAESLGVAPPEDQDFTRVVSANLHRWCTELIALRRVVPVEQRVHSVAYTPDGRFFVTGDEGGRVRWFDAATGEPTGKIFQQSGVITCIDVSRDGKLLAAGSTDRELRVWEIESGELHFPPIPQLSTVTSVEFNSSGHQLAVSTGIVYLDVPSFARVYDATSGQPVSPPLEHPKAVNGIKFHTHGTSVLTSCNDGLLRTWEITTGQIVGEPLKFAHPLGCMAANHNRELLAVACGDQVYIVYVPTCKLEGDPFDAKSGVGGLAFHPNHVLVAAVGNDGNARVWNRTSREMIGAPLRHQNYANSAAFSPDGLSLVTGSEDKHARLFDLPLRAMAGIPVEQTDRRLMLRDNPRTLVSGRPRTYVTGRIPARIPHWIWDYLSASFSEDGRYVATGSMDNHAYVWDLTTGKRVGQPLKHANWVRSVSFHPDSRRVATGSHDMTARLWDAATGEPVSSPLAMPKEVSWVEFSEDGTLLLATAGHVVQMWKTETGELHGRPLRHSEAVAAACFSRDGRAVAASIEGAHPVVQFWDAATSHPLGPPLHAIRTVTGLQFEEGDRTLLTCSDEGITRRWAVPQDALFARDSLREMPRIVTGQKFAQGNVRVPLDPAEHRELRGGWLNTELGRRWQGSPADIESWHDAQAATNEIILDGGAAFWHLERLIKARRDDWTLPARYCAALHRYGIEPGGVEQWQRARELGGTSQLFEWCHERALQKERIRSADEALRFRKKALELEPDDVEALRALGHCQARLGRYGEAQDQFLRVVAMAPHRADALRDVAMTQLALDDRAGYQVACRRMLELAMTTDDIETAYMTALACVLDAECVSDWTPVVALATRCAAAYEGDECLRVAALYRAGRLDEDLIEKRNTTQVRFTHNVWEWFFQGMLQWKAGRQESGRTILREKIEMVNLMDQHFPRDQHSQVWVDWIYHVQCHALAKEAKAILESSNTPQPNPR